MEYMNECLSDQLIAIHDENGWKEILCRDLKIILGISNLHENMH